MRYQIQILTVFADGSRGFQWNYRDINAKTHKQARLAARRVLRSLQKEVRQEIKEGKRKPEHLLALAIGQITACLKNGCGKVIYQRKKKFYHHKP